MSKPDMKDAPEWAVCKAQDGDGEWWWFEQGPQHSSHWVCEDGRMQLASKGDPNPNWRDTLTRVNRPTERRWTDQLTAWETERNEAIESLASMSSGERLTRFAGQNSTRHMGHTLTWEEVMHVPNWSEKPTVDAVKSLAHPNEAEDYIVQADRFEIGGHTLDSLTQLKANEVNCHYHHHVRIPVTQADLDRGYVEYRLDPYRVCDVYDVGGGPREQMAKKLLRWTDKGQNEEQVLNEIQSAMDRWREMRAEDKAATDKERK